MLEEQVMKCNDSVTSQNQENIWEGGGQQQNKQMKKPAASESLWK